MEISRFDAAEMLDTPSVVVEYLRLAWESGDPSEFVDALGVVARSEGMSKIARKTGLGRESLYKSLSADGNPSFATVFKVLDACGLTLEPTEKAKETVLA